MDDNFSNRGSEADKIWTLSVRQIIFFKGGERILQISFFKWFRQTIEFQILVSFGGGGSG